MIEEIQNQVRQNALLWYEEIVVNMFITTWSLSDRKIINFSER